MDFNKSFWKRLASGGFLRPAPKPNTSQTVLTSTHPAAVFGFAGYSGSGKTTLIEKLIPLFVAHGLTVSLIKHAHHDFDVDQPGKDSFRHRKAGCREVLVSSDQRWALMHELHQTREPNLNELIAHLAPCDWVLVEGFKRSPIRKLEVHRTDNGKPLLYPQDSSIVALACEPITDAPIPTFDINDIEQIFEFITGCYAKF